MYECLIPSAVARLYRDTDIWRHTSSALPTGYIYASSHVSERDVGICLLVMYVVEMFVVIGLLLELCSWDVFDTQKSYL